MRKKNYMHLSGIGILCLMLNIPVIQGQNSVLILKGNTVSPASPKKDTGHVTKKAVAKPANKPAAALVATKAPADKQVQPKPKTAPVAQPKPKPVVAKAAPKPAPVGKNKKGAQGVDYVQRVLFVHNLVCKRFPQSTIDSIQDVNHVMLDSLRSEITRHKDKDSLNFLQAALTNGVSDSMVILTINNLVNAANVKDVIKNTGSVKTYCIDLSTQAPMDSVKVSVYTHDSLVATSFSGSDGFCLIENLKPGEYSLSFAKNNYTPFSDRFLKVAAQNVTNIEMPLTETPRFYIPRFSAQIWAMILVGIVSVFVLVYSIIRRLGRVA